MQCLWETAGIPGSLVTLHNLLEIQPNKTVSNKRLKSTHSFQSHRSIHVDFYNSIILCLGLKFSEHFTQEPLPPIKPIQHD